MKYKEPALMDVAEVQAKLPELLDRLKPGEELVVTQDGWPIGKLVGFHKAGSCKGLITIVSDDDEHLKDFKDYM